MNGITRLHHDERGSALMESAIVLPMILLVMVGIFELGRAFQTWQVLTNAAREGARAAVVPSANVGTVEALVHQYMEDGQLAAAAAADVTVDQGASLVVNGTTVGATEVTVAYPFEFSLLQPVASLVVPDTDVGEPITMRARSLMRNEAQ